MMLPPPKDMLAELVALPSVSSPDPKFDQSNKAVIALLAEWAEAAGFRVRVLPLSDPSKLNLVATKGEGAGGLVLSGHSDTVPFDASRWASDPFTLTERDGRLHGLGAADMKGFFPAALHAAASFDANVLSKPLVLIATADEESTMNGARALLGSYLGGEGFSADAAIIGEPTGMVPVNMHKGISMHQVCVRGQSGHSSDPSLGQSALEGMHQVIDSLLTFRQDISAQRNDAFAVPTATLNLGKIAGGDSPNRICGECSLSFDVRLLPGMDGNELMQDLQARMLNALDDRLALSLSRLVEDVPAFHTPNASPIVAAVEEIAKRSVQAVMFCTEAPFYSQMGMQTLIWGAGDIAVAHQADEYTSLQGLNQAASSYATLVQRLCTANR